MKNDPGYGYDGLELAWLIAVPTSLFLTVLVTGLIIG